MKSRWLQISVAGVLLFVAAMQALRYTGNPNFIPSVLMLGSFVVPVAFVAYFLEREQVYDRGIHQDSPLMPGALCFIVGGLLGVIAAGVVEYEALRNLRFVPLFGVGLIEEASKLILPFILFFRGRYRSEADGLVFGVASGMGFAAFETMGYGLTAVIKSGGNLGLLENVLLVRGLLSPAGHAAWTGFLCAVLWRERVRGSKALTLRVIGAFLAVVALHSAWNLTSALGGPAAGQVIFATIGGAVIAAISLTLLFRRLHESKQYIR